MGTGIEPATAVPGQAASLWHCKQPPELSQHPSQLPWTWLGKGIPCLGCPVAAQALGCPEDRVCSWGREMSQHPVHPLLWCPGMGTGMG